MATAKDGSIPMYGSISYISQTTTTITIRIAANSVLSTEKNIPILIQMNPRTIDDGTTFENVFTQLGISWDKLYVNDSSVSQNLYTDTWIVAEDFGRVWVVLDELTTAAKDLVIVFDGTAAINPDNKWVGVNTEE